MTVIITHQKVSSGTANPDVEVDLADWNDTHAIAGLDEALALKADIASPTFTGTATTPILSTTDHYEENATTAHAYTLRARTNVALAYPVPTLRAKTANSPVALDLWPSGPVPVEAAGGNGFTWFDACDADLQVDELTPIRCARMGITSTAVQFGCVNFNGATALPINFIVGSGGGTAVKAAIDTNGIFKLGLGTDTPVFSSAFLQINPTTANPAAAIRDNVNHSEWFSIASTDVYTGSATSHKYIIRTNNVDRATFDTSGGLFMAGATGSGQGSGTVNATGLSVNGAEVGMMRIITRAINMNSANTDTSITIPLPTGYTRYLIQSISIGNASGTLTTATAGVFSAAAAGGTTVVANVGLTVSTASANTVNNIMNFTVATGLAALDFTTLFFRVGTPQGAARTADVTIYILPME